MKFQVDRDVFADAVAWTARALPARPAVPILAGMHLAVIEHELTLSTFDYEVSAKSAVPVTAGAEEKYVLEGSALIPGRLLAEIVKSLPPRPVDLETDGARVTLKCGSAKFTLNTIPDGEYPAMPAMPDEAGKVGADLLASAIGQVAIAASRDDSLPALTAIRMEIDGDTVTLVATDRYRLAVRELHWEPVRPDLKAAILVPARAFTEAARALTSSAEVSIGLSATGDQGASGIIGWSAGGWETTTRLIGGEYPRYQTLLPSEFSAVAELDVAPFADAVKRVALVAEAKTPIRLAFSREGGLLLEAGHEATAAETVEARFDGAPLNVAFNPQFLLDGLTAIDSGTARFSFTTSTRPAVLTGKRGDEEVPDYRYVLMPIKAAG